MTGRIKIGMNGCFLQERMIPELCEDNDGVEGEFLDRTWYLSKHVEGGEETLGNIENKTNQIFYTSRRQEKLIERG